MSDGRRHSVDFPISKALLALQRVRSLRDPSTNSTSKLNAVVDNVTWETNSSKGVSLRFGSGLDYDGPSGLRKLACNGPMEQHVPDHNSNHNSDEPNFAPISCKDIDWGGCGISAPLRTRQVDRLDNQEEVDGSKMVSGRNYEADVVDDTALLGGSTHSASSCANDAADILDDRYRGCGLSRCWSRTPRFRESNLTSDTDQRLVSEGLIETGLCGQKRSLEHANNDTTQCLEHPRSLSQKFRPKFFTDLVGQNVVARSLLNAIAQGRITSSYIFYGPRGTGKTSSARIFAAALNCLSQEESGPCGSCQQCNHVFSGKNRDVREVDSVKINQRDRVILLIRNAVKPPVSSRFKIFIFDECQFLQKETWAIVLNSLRDLPQHVVFVFITPELDKLPRIAVSWSQRYHFPKIKDADISTRLEKLCVKEDIDFDQVALDFVAAKSNGSVRDAEMALDQLSLLDERITLPLVHELIGVVPDDELLNLLDLAFSSDASNTVKMARKLLKSRIDPIQLISQLANLIMDILAGSDLGETDVEVKKSFFRKHASEGDLLSHALKILSEAEKQLRASNNQTTWLIVALLQLGSVESSLFDLDDARLCPRTHSRDGDFSTTPSTGESLKHLATCVCDNNNPNKSLMGNDCKVKLESIWKRATELCRPNSLRNFLRREGKLSSILINQGLAVAELEFHRLDYVSRAEKSWKLIAKSLQTILDCNIEIKINLAPETSNKPKKLSFSFFCCCRKLWRKMEPAPETGTLHRESPGLISGCGPQISHICCCRIIKEPRTPTIGDGEGNALSMVSSTPVRTLHVDVRNGSTGDDTDSSMKAGSDCACKVSTIKEPKIQKNCLPRNLKLVKKLGP